MSLLLQMSGPVVDMVYAVKALPASGTEAEVTGFRVTPGGGFNAMAAARSAGMPVRLGGSLGSGPLAALVTQSLDRLGISRARPPLEGIDQGCCTVLLEPDGERSFLSAPGAEGRIGPEDLDGIALEEVSTVLVSGYTLTHPGTCTALASWVAALPLRITVMFDPAPVAARLEKTVLGPVLGRADWISANRREAAALSGETAPDKALSSLAAGRRGALLRDGDKGCLLATAGKTLDIAPHKVSALDTNGAGDCHIGSFAAELARTGDPLQAARYANIAAALSTTRAGPATPPAREEVAALL